MNVKRFDFILIFLGSLMFNLMFTWPVLRELVAEQGMFMTMNGFLTFTILCPFAPVWLGLSIYRRIKSKGGDYAERKTT